ncbi:uncharacterized protein LOC117333198 [Pecten maximus]|uniref:uncharacterized protein LOC117333198 n=1 Tax=Pecten maximus TaxID=6579 RepID=UPI001457EEFE|nr:uncharacterized protein LOC117333198 [Pecten maximus]
MIPRVILVVALCYGCFAAPLEPGRSNRGMVNAFQDMVGGWMGMMTGLASGMGQTMETGVGTMMNMFGDFSPSHWKPPDSNTNLASIVALNTAVKPSATVTTVAPTTTTLKSSHWIVFGKK